MKKVFISADIEGTAFAATWDSTHIGGHDYERNRQEMTNCYCLKHRTVLF